MYRKIDKGYLEFFYMIHKFLEAIFFRLYNDKVFVI